MKKLEIWIPPPGSRRRKRGPRWGWVVASPFVLLLALGALSLREHYPLSAGPGGPRREVAGAYHVHSTRSDGRLTPDQIALAAQRAGLDFVVLTDHNLAQLPAPEYRHGVLLVSGVELSTPTGHLVALGISRGLTAGERAHDPIGQVASLGGVSVIAHPVQYKMPWSDWKDAPRASGLELFSADTMLREAVTHPIRRLLPALGAYWVRPLHALMELTAPQPQAEAHLLKMAAAGPKIALCAQDAHGLPPPAERAYEVGFRAFSMHLPGLQRPLPPDPKRAADEVLHALTDGSAYCGFEAIAPASGFALEGLGPDRRAMVGERIGVVLPKVSGLKTEVRVAGAGALGPDGKVLLERPGAVEIEVWAKGPGALYGNAWRPWIVPSPIQVVAEAKRPAGSPPSDGAALKPAAGTEANKP